MDLRRSPVGWICATAAPWALAAGLLVSFTAEANNDPRAGISAAARAATSRPLEPAFLVPSAASVAGLLGLSGLSADAAILDGLTPRADAKAFASPAPEVARAGKGDPAVPLRSSLSRRGAEVGALFEARAVHILFSHDESLLPPTVMMEGKIEGPETENQVFEPWNLSDFTTTKQTSSVQSPAAAAAGSTGAAAGSATPTVARAVALSSTTPAPADQTPVEIAAVPVSPRLDRDGNPFPKSETDRLRYADLVTPDTAERESRCLAEAIYFEARSEPEQGQAAVAQVVLNRAKSGLYPSSICGVVYQNRQRHLACQFTFACEGKSLRITDRDSWMSARRIAAAVLGGRTYVADVGGATHYHADYVRPHWARSLKKMDVIGRHIFYKLRAGQT